jgi:hypothetical protein
MDSSPNICKVEYEEGYVTYGMPERYTTRMLFGEFSALTPDWRFLPTPCYKRNAQGWIIHETLVTWKEQDDLTGNDSLLLIPQRIQEWAARATEINLRADQLQVIDYLAQEGQTALVGISMFVDNHQIEYWLERQIQPIEYEPLEMYLVDLRDQWLAELSGMAPLIAQFFQDVSIDYVLRMSYQGNTLRLWFGRRDQEQAGLTHLAEAPTPKDVWISPDDQVVSAPPTPNEFCENHASLLFSGVAQGVPASNPEIPDDHIALIATNNHRVQTPSNSLERMHACLQNQVAFN